MSQFNSQFRRWLHNKKWCFEAVWKVLCHFLCIGDFHRTTACHAKISIPRYYFVSINPKQLSTSTLKKKQYQQKTGLIQRWINNAHLCRLVWLWQRSFVWESVFVCCSQVSVAWKTIACQRARKSSVKHRQIWRGNCL